MPATARLHGALGVTGVRLVGGTTTETPVVDTELLVFSGIERGHLMQLRGFSAQTWSRMFWGTRGPRNSTADEYRGGHTLHMPLASSKAWAVMAQACLSVGRSQIRSTTPKEFPLKEV